MDDQQLQTVIRALQGTVQETVNGKIDKIDKKLDTHIAKHDAMAQDIQSLVDLKRAGITLQSAAKWLKDMGIYIFIGWEILKNIR